MSRGTQRTLLRLPYGAQVRLQDWERAVGDQFVMDISRSVAQGGFLLAGAAHGYAIQQAVVLAASDRYEFFGWSDSGDGSTVASVIHARFAHDPASCLKLVRHRRRTAEEGGQCLAVNGETLLTSMLPPTGMSRISSLVVPARTRRWPIRWMSWCVTS